MQLDRTHVAVRLRTLSEIGDLALVMIRRYPQTAVAFAAGAGGWAAIDLVLLGWIPLEQYEYGLSDEEALPELWRYVFWMAALVFLQTPSAGALMTCYLGQAVFEERPSRREVWRETVRFWWRWVAALGIQRLAIPAALVAAMRWGQPATFWGDVLIPMGLVLSAAWLRATRPFVPEMLLLERCPLRGDSPEVITVRRRSRALHLPLAGDNFGRFLAVALVMAGLFGSLFYTLMFLRGIAFGQWNYLNLVVLLVIYPLALWAVAYVSVLIRFLVYLDARIRLEGWEVELAMQAEAMRQFGNRPEPPSVRLTEDESAGAPRPGAALEGSS